MDFVDVVRSTKGTKVLIPYFHRVPISLLPDTETTAVLLDSPFKTKGASEFAMLQIAITPMLYDDWNHLWKITCELTERTGVLNNILEIVRRFGLNIAVEVSRGIVLNEYHKVELIVSDRHSKYRDKAIHLAKEAILEEYIEHIRITKASQPALSVKKMSVHPYLKRAHNEGFEAEVKKYTAILPSEKKRRGVYLDIPEEWHNFLKKRNDYPKEAKNLNYIIHTNTNDQVTSIYFPHIKRIIGAFRISHSDEVGALAAITRALQEADINLISSLTRKQKENVNEFEFLCECIDPKREIHTPEKLIKLVIEYLQQDPYVKHFAPSIYTPRSEFISWKDDWDLLWYVEPHDELSQTYPLPKALPDDDRRERLRQKRLAFKQKLDEDTAETQTEANILKARIQIIDDLLTNSYFAKPRVFVSYQLNKRGKVMLNCIKEIFSDFDIVEGSVIPGRTRISKGIVEKLNNCHFYLGVLTVDQESKKKPKHGYASPWILFEYGIALGIGKTLQERLIKANNVGPRSYAPEQGYQVLSFEPVYPFECTKGLESHLKSIARDFNEVWRDFKPKPHY